MAAAKTKKEKCIQSVGRSKSSSVRVRVHKGKEQSMVNDRPIGEYFPGKVMAAAWEKPLELTGTKGEYYITAKISGGGKNGQLDALMHATAKALCELNKEEFRPILKKAGLLTRDSRERERRKPGTGGRARKQKQSPKR